MEATLVPLAIVPRLPRLLNDLFSGMMLVLPDESPPLVAAVAGVAVSSLSCEVCVLSVCCVVV